MTTRDRITDEALTLFSKYGYEGVTVKDIAAAVGIKDSSLYKHYASKQVIFDTIVEQMETRLNDMHAQLKVPDARTQDASSFFSGMTESSMNDVVTRMFLFYLKDSVVSRIRKLFTIEQYGKSAIAQKYGDMFIDSALDYQAEVFRQMMASGAFISGDPDLMALQFYSPIFLLLCKVDVKPEAEHQAIVMLRKHVTAFGAQYGAPREGESK